MNRIEEKEAAPDAAKLFREEVREIAPDIPREVLCPMVGDYVYFQQDEITKDESRVIVEETCLKN